jgi:hypothetical protein
MIPKLQALEFFINATLNAEPEDSDSKPGTISPQQVCPTSFVRRIIQT